MPIFEFKCAKCEEFFEILVMKDGEQGELNCPKCKSGEFERVLSATNYSMGSGSGGGTGMESTERKCSSGSCTTYDLPGPSA